MPHGTHVGGSYVHLGIFNAVVALSIASVKASLVALFFMHLKSEKDWSGPSRCSRSASWGF